MAEQAFSLEVEGWEDATLLDDADDAAPSNAPENEPAVKRPKLSLSLKRRGSMTPTRFELLDNAREEALSKKFVPKNTEKSTQWALSTFLTWCDKRNERFKEEPDKHVLLDLLGTTDSPTISKWLSLYVAEVRKKDGMEYPPKSLYMLLTGILRCMRSKNATCPNFLDT